MDTFQIPFYKLNPEMNNSNAPKSTRYNFTWWMKNLLIAAVVYMLCPSLVKSNLGYEWLIDGYAKSNLEAVRQIEGFTNDQKLEAKLGYDYAFIEMIRRTTPENAVVFYPSREDFTDKAASTGISFSGNLCDKLSAVRFLYPRKIVIKQELNKTSWSKKLTHVAIVNGHWRELLPYKVSDAALITVLPTSPAEAAKLQNRQ